MKSSLHYLIVGLVGAGVIAGAALLVLGALGVAWWAGWLP